MKNNIFFKTLAVIALLFVCSTDEKGFPFFIFLFIWVLQIFMDVFNGNSECIGLALALAVFIGNLLIFFNTKNPRLLLFSFTALFLSVLAYSGILFIKTKGIYPWTWAPLAVSGISVTIIFKNKVLSRTLIKHADF